MTCAICCQRSREVDRAYAEVTNAYEDVQRERGRLQAEIEALRAGMDDALIGIELNHML